MLIRMGIAYDEPKAADVGGKVMKFIADEADRASEQLVGERGPFPNFSKSILANRPRPLRNAIRTTIAPTGTISIIAGCSGGIEPIFAVAFERRVLGTVLREVHADLETLSRKEGFQIPDGLMQQIIRTGVVRPFPEIPALVRKLFVTSREVPPLQHLAIQAAFQRHTDNAVSKTLNLPAETTVEEVREIYLKAFELGCKGVTVYRDTSRKSQVLAVECCNLADARIE
jgi:ribonucleoside-diphosphate reductase alpha chain